MALHLVLKSERDLMSLHLVLKSETDLNTYFLRVRGILCLFT
jgi:hypothetical protein